MLNNIFGWIYQLLYVILGIYPNDVDLAMWWLSRQQEDEPQDYYEDDDSFFGDDDE